MPTNRPTILGFAAYSGTGKTTLLTALLPMFTEHGYRVGVIKYSHHDVEIDYPGKDSYRLRKAGANPTVLVSPYRQVRITEFESPQTIDLTQQIEALAGDNLDLILIEGFRDYPLPKIELHRPSLGKPLLFPNDPHIIAVASDETLVVPTKLPCLNLNQPAHIFRFIIEQLLEPQS